jgi:excisionase family DNA binding protein
LKEVISDGLLDRLQSYDRALTASEVAELLSTSKSTIHRLCDQREMPHFKLGKLTRFLPSKIAQWIIEKQAIVAFRTGLRNEEREERGRIRRRAA